MESKSFRSQKPNLSNSHARRHKVRALRNAHLDNSSCDDDDSDDDDNESEYSEQADDDDDDEDRDDNDNVDEDEDPIPLYKIDDNGKTTLKYSQLVHDNLPKEYFKYFNPQKYRRTYSGLWRRLEDMKFGSVESPNDKTAMFTIFYNYMEEYELHVFLDPRLANNLDYSHVVVDTEVSVFRDVLAKVMPPRFFASFCIAPTSETCLSFSRALNAIWDAEEMFKRFYPESCIRDPSALLGFSHLIPIIHATDISDIEDELSSITRFIGIVTKGNSRDIYLSSSSCKKINSCETDIDMIKTYCIEYMKAHRPERYVDEDYERDTYEREMYEYNKGW